VLQSLANGYFMLFGAVLIGLWLVYFCSTRDSCRAAPAIIASWGLASLALAPIMWKYMTVHEHFGLRRSMGDAITFSAPSHAWFEVSSRVWLWSRVLRESMNNLFPGVTALTLVLGACSWRHGARDRRTDLSEAEDRARLPDRRHGRESACHPADARQRPVARGLLRARTAIVELDLAIGVLFWCGVPLLLLAARTRRPCSADPRSPSTRRRPC
jgi:hypothetical protein